MANKPKLRNATAISSAAGYVPRIWDCSPLHSHKSTPTRLSLRTGISLIEGHLKTDTLQIIEPHAAFGKCLQLRFGRPKVAFR